MTELEKIGIIHLYTLGFRGDDLVSFRLRLNNPSKIAELQDLEEWKTRFEIASGATENFFSRRWISQNIFNLSEEEFVRNQREMFHDRKFESELNATAEAAAEQASSALGSGSSDSLDVGLEGGEGGGLEAPTPEEPAATPETPEPEAPASDEPAPDTGPLLDTPASKRDDRDRKTTP